LMSPHEITKLAQELAELLSLRLASTMTDVDRWLDLHDVAEQLKCSTATVERMAASGELPSTKFGRLRRYRKSDVMARGSRDVE